MPRSDVWHRLAIFQNGSVAFSDRREDLELDRSLQCFGALIRIDGLEEQLRCWLLRWRTGHCRVPF